MSKTKPAQRGKAPVVQLTAGVARKPALEPAEEQDPVQRIVSALQAGIRAGRIAPGQRLVEGDLAADLGVSRGPVREALRILAGEGIVELMPRRSARVRRLTSEDAVEMLPALAALTTASMRLALPHLKRADVRRSLESAIERMREAARERDNSWFQHASITYFEALQAAHGNRYIRYLNDKLHPDLFHRQLAEALQLSDWETHLSTFERVHTALLAGKLAAAEAALEEYGRSMHRVLGGD